MSKFDTKVQYLKYLALREVARHEWEGDLKEKLLDIKKEVIELKERTIQVLEKYNNTMSDLLEYVYQKDLKVILSVENLDDKTWTVRLDKREMREIIYNNENAFAKIKQTLFFAKSGL